MTPTADTPVPRQLSEEERALWEKASAVRPTDRITQIDADFIEACSPAVILSLLTALSSEREAGERERKALADALTPDIVGVDDEVYYAEENFADIMDEYGFGEVRELWANKQLGMVWAAKVVLTRDADGDPDDYEVRLFNTRREAEAAANPTEPAHAD